MPFWRCDMSKLWIFSPILFSIVACQSTPPAIDIPPGMEAKPGDTSGRSAVVDCRAGCQGSKKGCQESLIKQARLDSQPGRYFDFTTLRVTARSNASNSPGLVRDPNWNYERFPTNASHPTSIIIRPIVATCEGRSEDTQGVTFYQWTADYFPLGTMPPANE